MLLTALILADSASHSLTLVKWVPS